MWSASATRSTAIRSWASSYPGPILASGGTIEAAIHGRGGHASAPHDCLDPILIACEIVQALQTLVTRRVDAFDPVVVTITKVQAGIHRRVGMFHEENQVPPTLAFHSA
jgi:metal-dependent amidase/aminoacylase/carboxypeptidase family protein